LELESDEESDPEWEEVTGKKTSIFWECYLAKYEEMAGGKRVLCTIK
jgi:hypothetical protein